MPVPKLSARLRKRRELSDVDINHLNQTKGEDNLSSAAASSRTLHHHNFPSFSTSFDDDCSAGLDTPSPSPQKNLRKSRSMHKLSAVFGKLKLRKKHSVSSLSEDSASSHSHSFKHRCESYTTSASDSTCTSQSTFTVLESSASSATSATEVFDTKDAVDDVWPSLYDLDEGLDGLDEADEIRFPQPPNLSTADPLPSDSLPQNLPLSDPLPDKYAVDIEICPSANENLERCLERKHEVVEDGVYSYYFTRRDIVWVMNDGSQEMTNASVQMINYAPFFDGGIPAEERIVVIS
ncbi:hypothetical protein BZA70DRAFT_142670 [Myxozyma melibiosi]|uniref:Uncharacterized protein n=1 Tax=Myxozyma melibiosi TaxID=54550 RepID=A0ABR1F9N7_9ASCO